MEVTQQAAGRERTYADVVAAHAPALLRLAVMLTGERTAAEDLLQATLLRTVPHGDRVAAMAAPAAYLRRVMVNEHTSRGRGLARRVRTSSVAEPPEPLVAPGSDAVDLRDEAWRWLASLRPLQRAVLVLRFYEDLPDAEIAAVLGCSEATVRSHAFRGLAALRAHLAESAPEEDR